MIDNSLTMTSLFAFILALAISFACTPAVRMLAIKIKAVDVPKDNRRMHKVPIPRMGGLAIFAGFLVSVLFFVPLGTEFRSILIGAPILVVLGIIDDIVALKPKTKFAGQIIAALIPALSGVSIHGIVNPFVPGQYSTLGIFSIPLTVIWIVGITNAVNFIDGLDGLACGVSAIATVTMFIIAVLFGETYIALMMAALAGACLGFLPYNMNYCLAIAFVLAALVKQVVSEGATLYYYNRNTGEVEYNSGNNDGGQTLYPPPLYTKRYFAVVDSSNSTETTPLDRRIWLLLHRHQFGLTLARRIRARQRTDM